MVKTIGFVLCLGFWPFSKFGNNYCDLKADRPHWVIQGLQANDANNYELGGIMPKIVVPANFEQSAPTFAGAKSHLFLKSEIDLLSWLRQKKKPAGLVIRRKMTCFVVSENLFSSFSGEQKP